MLYPDPKCLGDTGEISAVFRSADTNQIWDGQGVTRNGAGLLPRHGHLDRRAVGCIGGIPPPAVWRGSALPHHLVRHRPTAIPADAVGPDFPAQVVVAAALGAGPRVIGGSTATASPATKPRTPWPTSTTHPASSWPMTTGSDAPVRGCGDCAVGMRRGPSRYSCRSVPQMPHQSTAILTVPDGPPIQEPSRPTTVAAQQETAARITHHSSGTIEPSIPHPSVVLNDWNVPQERLVEIPQRFSV